MYYGDVADHFKIAYAILEGRINKAGNLAENLDTSSREDIPQGVWHFITDAEDDDY
jgi:hypothetical protein